MRRLLSCFSLVLASCIAAGTLPKLESSAPTASRAQHESAGVAVATENAQATQSALEVLRAGGSAADAAIAAALVLGVVNPVSSGIGGGGFALVWDNKEKRVSALDFRETAPQDIDPSSLDLRPVPNDRRGAMVGVPGEVAGLLEIHRRWGKRNFADDVQAAIGFAEKGFSISPHMARSLSRSRSEMLAVPDLASFFFPQGVPLATGNRAFNPRLGATLKRISTQGRDAFYAGSVATDIVRTTRAHGGALQASDLAKYQVIERKALEASWEDLHVATMPPPSAGGLLLLQALGMHDRKSLRAMNPDSADTAHLYAETFRASLADRMRLVGDPKYINAPLDSLLSASHLRAMRGRISQDRTTPAPDFPAPEGGTTHIVVVDVHRNVVSLTTTVNGFFGSRILCPETGILLNDELDDFTPPQAPRLFGIQDDGPNAPRPGARPVSSMTPTIVFRNAMPVAALGGSGGMRIAPNVVQVFFRLFAFGSSAKDAVDAPRLSVDAETNKLWLEPNGWSDAEIESLRARGEKVSTTSFPTAVQLVLLTDAQGQQTLQAASDPRKFGVAQVEN